MWSVKHAPLKKSTENKSVFRTNFLNHQWTDCSYQSKKKTKNTENSFYKRIFKREIFFTNLSKHVSQNKKLSKNTLFPSQIEEV